MASTSETGHAKNVAHLNDLIAFVTGYGPTYSPSKSALKITNLNIKATTATGNLADVISKNTILNTAINNRVTVFSDLKKLSTRLMNALEATDASPEKIKDAAAYNRKIQGKRAKSAAPADPNAPETATISVSQQSYDQYIEHFAGLISVLESESSYAPNETELKITALQAKKAAMVIANSTVVNAYVALSNIRIARDHTLYDPATGLVETADEVKKYVKSVFGSDSPEYAQVKGLEFRTINK